LADGLGMTVNNATFSRSNPERVVMLDKQGTRVSLFVSEFLSQEVRRLAIAHAIGHYVLQFKDVPTVTHPEPETNLYIMGGDLRSSDEAKNREVEASVFARALLMPQRQVRDLWSQLQSVTEMARVFRVNELAMGERLLQLGLH